jgi:hypothetical protein
VADCIFKKRDKRRLSVQGVILRLIYSPIDVDKFQLQIENGEVFVQEKYLEISDEKSNSTIMQEIKKH